MHTSINTFARGLSSQQSPARAAGHYSNSTAALVAKGIVGLFTAAIGLGIICLIEHYGNVVPKVREFARNSKLIYQGVLARDGQNPVRITLEDQRRMFNIREIQNPDGTTDIAISIDDGPETTLTGMSFDKILTRLREDYERNPDLYDHIYDSAGVPASTWIPKDRTMRFDGSNHVLGLIKNQLLVESARDDRLDLSILLVRAYAQVTGQLLDEEEVADLPTHLCTQGATGTLVSPKEFFDLFNQIVQEAGDENGWPEIRNQSDVAQAGSVNQSEAEEDEVDLP